MISIFDETGIKAIKKLKLKDIKIPSGEINNYPLLRQVGKLKKNVILSTGMSTYKEVKNAIDILIKNGTIKNNITVLQCNSSYPSPHKDANLKVMKEYEKKFGIKAGYSDHTPGIESSMAAVALGAKIIEKHFTLSKRSKGPDHSSSLSPKEFSLLTKSIRKVTESLGNRDKKITKSERQNVKIVRKSIVAKTFISKGEKFNSNNITVKRPAGGLGPEKWDQIKGKIAKKISKKMSLSKYKKKICFITGSRAEYGLLRNLILSLNKEKALSVKLIVTGSHLLKQFGNTSNEILREIKQKFLKR